MKKVFTHSLFLTAAAVVALLLMGAGSEQQSGVTSSMTSIVASGVSSSMTSTVTSSMATSIGSMGTSTIESRVTASHVKSCLTSSMTNSHPPCVTSGITGTQVILSPYAEEVARIIKFDRQILVIVKEITHERIGRLIGFDGEGYQIIAPGIVVSVPADKADTMLAVLRHRLQPLHYMAFVVEMNNAIKAYKIGVLKGTDQYEILRIMHTDGDDYDISNQDVIDWLKELEKKAPFEIVGADTDWVEIEFKTVPKDLKTIVEEAYDFCPDAVDQGPGSVDELVNEIRKTKRLLLLWE
ncbi:MAG TPA: DUF4253 domain-containing protein [Nitrospirota bacterium]|nr:DUF4253 domain-containing protein [Nitrospirota bacterium]